MSIRFVMSRFLSEMRFEESIKMKTKQGLDESGT